MRKQVKLPPQLYVKLGSSASSMPRLVPRSRAPIKQTSAHRVMETSNLLTGIRDYSVTPVAEAFLSILLAFQPSYDSCLSKVMLYISILLHSQYVKTICPVHVHVAC